jgi:opacity protein-like surface antigen
MKKRSIIFVVVFMLLSIPCLSLGAAPKPYVSFQLGAVSMQDSDWSDEYSKGTFEYNTGIATGLAGGVKLGMFRIEGELGYQKSSLAKGSLCYEGECMYGTYMDGDMSVYSLLGNFYFDFVKNSSVTPYVTAGIGVANIELNDLGYDYDDTVLAYQVGAGFAFALDQQIIIDLKYRYFRTPELDFDGIKCDFSSNNIYLGLRYNF